MQRINVKTIDLESKTRQTYVVDKKFDSLITVIQRKVSQLLQSTDEQLHGERCAHVRRLPSASRCHGREHAKKHRDDYEGLFKTLLY